MFTGKGPVKIISRRRKSFGKYNQTMSRSSTDNGTMKTTGRKNISLTRNGILSSHSIRSKLPPEGIQANA
jgi:hypothetical protein